MFLVVLVTTSTRERLRQQNVFRISQQAQAVSQQILASIYLAPFHQQKVLNVSVDFMDTNSENFLSVRIAKYFLAAREGVHDHHYSGREYK